DVLLLVFYRSGSVTFRYTAGVTLKIKTRSKSGTLTTPTRIGLPGCKNVPVKEGVRLPERPPQEILNPQSPVQYLWRTFGLGGNVRLEQSNHKSLSERLMVGHSVFQPDGGPSQDGA